ncbi:MAG TPA: DUF4190 domain-containing protein [Beutenbergiaceae bacterium]|nr:DUF4190 domain-containing protein [Beutenbergiaceae bacterium]
MSAPGGFAPLHTSRTTPAPDSPVPSTQPAPTAAVHPSVFVNEFTRPLPDPSVTFSDAGYYTQPVPTSGFATAALICSLVGVITVVPAALAIVFGHIGIHRTRSHQRLGRGMAMGGMILGYAVSLFWTVLITTVWIANG